MEHVDRFGSTLLQQVEGARELSGISFIRALIPSRELHPHDFINPKTPPNTVNWAVEFHHEFWETQTFSL